MSNTRENIFEITPRRKLEALLRRQGLTFGEAMIIELEKGYTVSFSRKLPDGTKETFACDNPFKGSIVGIHEEGVDTEIYFSLYQTLIFNNVKGVTRLNFEDIKDVRPFENSKPTSQDK